MGSFYVNYTLVGADQHHLLDALAGRRAFVAPAQGDFLVVFDEHSEDQDTVSISSLSARLSKDLRCTVFVVLNHDDDILWYQLYHMGQLRDEYDSTPGYFDPLAGTSSPKGGNAPELCTLFRASNIDEVELVLRKVSFDESGYLFATDRHSDLVRALGLPAFTVGGGYQYIVNGEFSEGLSPEDLIQVT